MYHITSLSLSFEIKCYDGAYTTWNYNLVTNNTFLKCYLKKLKCYVLFVTVLHCLIYSLLKWIHYLFCVTLQDVLRAIGPHDYQLTTFGTLIQILTLMRMHKRHINYFNFNLCSVKTQTCFSWGYLWKNKITVNKIKSNHKKVTLVLLEEMQGYLRLSA